MPQAPPERESIAAASREAFAAWVDAAPEGRDFGQVVVRHSGGGYEIRHLDDVGRWDLELHEEQRAAREISKLTEEGEYRPLKSSPNLRRGWLLRVADDQELATAMGYLYPAAIQHWYLHQKGELQTTSFRENAARQSGIYKRVQSLTDEGAQNAARACCADEVCLKQTLWDIDEETPLAMDRGEGEIPCPEPCSVFVSFARRVRLLEREERGPDGLAPSEKEDLSALLGAAASGEVRFAREAEFEEPLNVRRMRYREISLSTRLQPEE